jgi:acyl carrier protein
LAFGRTGTNSGAIWQEDKPLVPERASEIENTVRAVLRDVLGLSAERVAAFDEETPLFGALPELDSMAVAGVLTEIEDRLGILIEDDDVDGETLETFGSLTRFAMGKAVQ